PVPTSRSCGWPAIARASRSRVWSSSSTRMTPYSGTAGAKHFVPVAGESPHLPKTCEGIAGQARAAVAGGGLACPRAPRLQRADLLLELGDQRHDVRLAARRDLALLACLVRLLEERLQRLGGLGAELLHLLRRGRVEALHRSSRLAD